MRCTSRWQLGVLALAFSGNVFAGPFEDADTAYQRGDYSAAMESLIPLAEQGDLRAQVNLGTIFQ